MYTLRPYQQDAVNATLNHFRHSNEPAVIVLPTGAGKSLVIAELARLARRKILVLTHVKELVEQNVEKFRSYGDQQGIKAGVFSAGLNTKQTDFQVTFASVQSVVRNLSLFATSYSLVIIDECHRVSELTEGETSSQYGEIIKQLAGFNADIKVLGLTATPYRMGLGWIYQYHYHGIKRSSTPTPFKSCIYELPLTYMIKHGFLTPPTMVDAPVAQYDFSALSSTANGNFNEAEVNALLVKYPRVTQAIIEQVEELAAKRQGVMIFAASVKHAKEICGYLPVDATALITGATDLVTRADLIEKFKNKTLKYLVNVSVLTTGFDAPHVDLIAILRPTESVSLYQQIVGRGLRLCDDKKDCLVIDYAGNGINIFYPEVGQKKPNSTSELVQVFCPSCGFANTFWGQKDQEGKVLEHYGRKCQGFLQSDEHFDEDNDSEPNHTSTIERIDCDYRFRFKECEHCNAENDIAARVCHQCNKDIVDPDDKLKAALKLKNAMVIRCAGMMFEFQQESESKSQKFKIRYFDEDGLELTETFDFTNHKAKFKFNRLYGRRLNHSADPYEFNTVDEVESKQNAFTPPDFVVARKQKHFWQIVERVFDYEGRYRKANELG